MFYLLLQVLVFPKKVGVTYKHSWRCLVGPLWCRQGVAHTWCRLLCHVVLNVCWFHGRFRRRGWRAPEVWVSWSLMVSPERGGFLTGIPGLHLFLLLRVRGGRWRSISRDTFGTFGSFGFDSVMLSPRTMLIPTSCPRVRGVVVFQVFFLP